MKQAVELAVEEKNAGCGIAGRPIELAVADDKGSVGAGLAIARDFISRTDPTCWASSALTTAMSGWPPWSAMLPPIS
jgi:ABC-type branched-subunit amino acid transport system substrate-binding protein